MIHKKGLSEIVSYTLLVVIAVGLSIAVYSYLSAYAPKDKPSCTQDVSLVISDAWCSFGNPSTLNLTILNKGLFKVDAAYIRFAAANRTVKSLINENDLYFLGSNVGLNPGNSVSKQYATTIPNSPGLYGIEIEPAVVVNNQLTLCPNSIIDQLIKCS